MPSGRKRFRAKRLSVLGPLLLIAVGCTSAPLTEKVRSDGRRVVLLLDASTSMRQNDPQQTAPLGAQLVMGLVGSEDNVGVLTYAAEAEVHRPLSPVGTARQGLGRTLAQVQRNGITNFAQALDTARAMLAEGNAPPGSPLILLTDGVPYRGRRRRDGPGLKAVLDQLAAKEWRIFAIALGEEAATPFLSRIVAATGGAVFPVTSADKLLDAFKDVATEALGYLRAQRGGGRAEVAPHTGRLAFLSRGGGLDNVAHDGQPAEAIRTQAGSFAVGLIEQPAPGTWTVEGEDVLALLEPRFALEFVANEPPERVRAGEEVQIGIRIVGEPDAVADVRDRLLLRAKLTLGEEPLGAPIPLRRQDEGQRFVATFAAPQVQEESALSLVVEAVIQGGDGSFVLRRTRALTVSPGDGTTAPVPLQLTLDPQRVKRGVWANAPPEQITLRVTGDPQRDCKLVIASRTVDLSAAATHAETVPLRAGTIEVQAKGPGGATFNGRISIALTRYTLQGDSKIELAPLPAGIPGDPHALNLSLSPKGTLEFTPSDLVGPGGASLPLTLTEGKLSATPPRDLPPGEYRGKLQVRVQGASDLPPREVPVTLRVLPPVQPPQPIKIRGSWGWVTAPVQVSWPAGREVPITIKPAALVSESASIRPQFDIRVQPLDGWSGKVLGAAPRRFALRVYLSADLPAGSYRGVVRFGPAESQLEVPVTLELSR